MELLFNIGVVLVIYSLHPLYMCGPMIVVWIRTFKRPKQHVRNIAAILTTSCQGLATVVTLQDQVLDSNISSSPFMLWLPLISVIGAPALFVLVMVFYFSLGLQTIDSSGALIGVLAVFAFSLAVYGFNSLMKKSGSLRFVDRPQVSKLLNRTRLGHGRGLTILACQDDNWKDCVHQAFLLADCVIVDAARWTQSLEWEFEHALELMGPERVILATPTAPGTTRLETLGENPRTAEIKVTGFLAAWRGWARLGSVVLPILARASLDGEPNVASRQVRWTRNRIFCGACGAQMGDWQASCHECQELSWKQPAGASQNQFCGACGGEMEVRQTSCQRCGEPNRRQSMSVNDPKP